MLKREGSGDPGIVGIARAEEMTNEIVAKYEGRHARAKREKREKAAAAEGARKGDREAAE
jgi:hypothetical protein